MTELDVFGVRITAQRYEEAIGRFLGTAKDGGRLRAHFCTVHSLVEASSNDRLRDVFATAGMVATDGIPLVWLARRRGYRQAERVCGPDVMLTLCDRGRDAGLRHFFLGGQPGVAEALAAGLTARFPGLEVVGTLSPPFRPLSMDEESELVASINDSGANVLWVGLGSPKQELWAAANEAALDVPLVLPVGAAFDFHSGRVRRAPRWIHRFGLEWLFRLAMEPRRLLRRYAITNTRFIVLLARDAVRRRGGSRPE